MQLDEGRLQEQVQSALSLAKKLGATQAAVGLSIEQGVSVGVRLQEVETLEAQQDQGFGLTVYVGKRKGSASTSAITPAAIKETVHKAVKIASFTIEDEFAGLADAERMASEFHELDLYHPFTTSLPELIERARECEYAARAVDSRINNSEGSSINSTQAFSLYANTHGFMGQRLSTSHSQSVSVIAEHEQQMERDYWYSVARDASDLTSPGEIGRIAGERTIKRLGAQKLTTRVAPVLFVPQMARGLFSSAISALSGSNQYRQSSFLLKAQGQTVFPDFVNLRIEPHLPKGLGSADYDAEGVATYARDLVKDGVIMDYVLGSYFARKLGLRSTANAGGVQNVKVSTSNFDQTALIQKMHTGLVVTELMGQGVNPVTGDYSRGASGFWVENGEIQYPVSEITIASNLKDMYRQIVAIGNDVNTESSLLTGSVLLESMTIAGE
ncbi:MAG: metalloprotease PmbA [Gammaproteobacteria bacterium]|nr:metalloprotease PmbA [Gammaproteobacteria bacterium]